MATHTRPENDGDDRRYDDLTAAEQADMRARWATQIAQRRKSLDLRTQFETEGRPYATLGVDGSVVIHNGAPLERRPNDQRS